MRIILALILSLLSSAALAQGKWAPFQAGAGAAAPSGCGGYVCTGGNWVTLPVGAGGHLTQLDVQCDQGFNACNNSGTSTYAISDDTYGGWIGFPGAWRQVNTISSGITFGSTGAGRSIDMVMAPSNTSHVYMMIDGRTTGNVVVSTNKGATWSVPAGWTFTEAGQVYFRNFSHYIAVDPFNENIAYIGTFNNGVVYTLNGGTTFNTISTATIPQSSGSAALIAFDPSDATGNTLYVSSYGSGVYKCTSATTAPSCSVAQSTGQPTTLFTMRVDPKGGVWGISWDGASCDNQCGSIYNLVSGTWTHVNGFGGSNSYGGIAIDTNNCTVEATCVVYVVERLGNLNGRVGGSWFSSDNQNKLPRTATDVPWLAWTKEYSMTFGGTAFDPAGSHRLIFTEGIGIWKTDPAPTATGGFAEPGPGTGQWINWTSITGGGIENLATNTIISIPGNDPLLGSQDRPIFRVKPGTYPSTHGCVSPTSLTDGWWATWVTATPSTVMAICNNPPELSGISTAGGTVTGSYYLSAAGWTAFGSTSYFASGNNWGGCIATHDGTNILIIPGSSGSPYFSTNGGTTWASINLGSLGTAGWGGGFPGFGYPKRCAVDRTNGQFAAYYFDGSNTDKVFTCTPPGCDTAGNWTQQCSQCKPGGGAALCAPFAATANINYVPNKTGWLMYAACPDDFSYTRGLVYLSQNSGNTWSLISPGITGLSGNWSFGAPCNGADYTAYFYGHVNTGPNAGHQGIWQADFSAASPLAPTWTIIGDQSNSGNPQPNTNDSIHSLAGDANTCGTVYIATGGTGFMYRTAAAATSSVTINNFQDSAFTATDEITHRDTSGNALDAHAGSIIKVGSTYYLYGESHACGFRPATAGAPWCGVKVYSSPDLRIWTYQGLMFDPNGGSWQTNCGGQAGNIVGCYQPQIIYNAANNNYVLWIYGETATPTTTSNFYVLTCTTPTGGATPSTPGTGCTQQSNATFPVGAVIAPTFMADGSGNGYAAYTEATGSTYAIKVIALNAAYTNTTGSATNTGAIGEGLGMFQYSGNTYVTYGTHNCAYCADAGIFIVSASTPLGTYSAPITLNATSCNAQNAFAFVAGGNPVAVTDQWWAQGSTAGTMPNQGFANLYFQPLTFSGTTPQVFSCQSSVSIAGVPPVGSFVSPGGATDQTDYADGFVDFCDISNNVSRLQQFKPTKTPVVSVALPLGKNNTSCSGFASCADPNGGVTVSLVTLDGSGNPNTTLASQTFTAASLQWATQWTTATFNQAVTPGTTYGIELTSTTSTTGACIGTAFNNSGTQPYANGVEKSKVGVGAWTTETGRSLLFSTY